MTIKLCFLWLFKMYILKYPFVCSGQLVGLVFQGLLIFICDWKTGSEEDPKNTIGERLAIAFAAIWGAVFGTIGIMNLKDRAGPPFPEGKLLTSYTHSWDKLFCSEQVWACCYGA